MAHDKMSFSKVISSNWNPHNVIFSCDLEPLFQAFIQNVSRDKILHDTRSILAALFNGFYARITPFPLHFVINLHSTPFYNYQFTWPLFADSLLINIVRFQPYTVQKKILSPKLLLSFMYFSLLFITLLVL